MEPTRAWEQGQPYFGWIQRVQSVCSWKVSTSTALSEAHLPLSLSSPLLSLPPPYSLPLLLQLLCLCFCFLCPDALSQIRKWYCCNIRPMHRALYVDPISADQDMLSRLWRPLLNWLTATHTTNVCAFANLAGDPGRFGNSPGQTLSSCTGGCLAGYACPAGSQNSTAVTCPAGQFSTSSASTCSLCPAGEGLLCRLRHAQGMGIVCTGWPRWL